MKTFLQWLKEDEDLIQRNNPGGDWLKHERARVKKEDRRGAQTAMTRHAVQIPVSHIAHFPGANGEHKFRDDPTSFKHARLAKEVGDPKNFSTKDHPILINVHHDGSARIAEGNHRTAYAHRHGISHVHAEITYHAGGENEKGPLHPDTLHKIVKRD